MHRNAVLVKKTAIPELGEVDKFIRNYILISPVNKYVQVENSFLTFNPVWVTFKKKCPIFTPIIPNKLVKNPR